MLAETRLARGHWLAAGVDAVAVDFARHSEGRGSILEDALPDLHPARLCRLRELPLRSQLACASLHEPSRLSVGAGLRPTPHKFVLGPVQQ